MKRNNFYILLLMCLINISLFPQGTWNWSNPNPHNNTIKDIHVFNATNTIYVGAGGIIYKTSDDGANWISQTSGTTSDLYSVHFPGASTGWVVGVSGTILKTTNGGTNWDPQPSGTTSSLYFVTFKDANTGWVVGGNGTILKTTNGGMNWDPQTSGTTNGLYSADFFDLDTGWAVGDNGTILRTTNGGTNWAAQVSPYQYYLMSVKFISTTIGWAVGSGGTILKTTNGGTNWSFQTSGTNEFLRSVNFVDVNTGWAVGGNGTILKTTDSGIHWALQTKKTYNDLYRIGLFDASTLWVVGENSTIIKTTNGGTFWSFKTSGPTDFLSSVKFINANTGWAVGPCGTIVKSIDGGTNWVFQSSGITENLASISLVDANMGWSVGNNGTILKTSNGGSNWVLQTSGTTNALSSVKFINANTGWSVGANGTILKTTNGGTNWTSQTIATTGYLESVYFVDANTGWVVGYSGEIFKTTNSGTSWVSQRAGGQSQNLSSVTFVDANLGWAVGSYKILKTQDGGVNWFYQVSGTGNNLYDVCFVDEYTGWAVGGNGTILKTTDSGIHWSSQQSGNYSSLLSVYFADENTGWAVGTDGTILKYTTNPVGSVTLTNPNGGENLFVSNIQTINWIRNRVNSIKLEYSTNNGSTWNLIVDSYPANSNSFTWVIPPTPSSQCKVKISDALNPGTFDISDDLFTISFPVSDSIFVSVNELDAAAGDTVILNVNVQLPPNSSFISAEINFDGFGNNLQFLEIDTTETLAGRAKWIYYNNFQDSVLYTAFAGSDSITGSGVLFKLKFVVPANSGAGFIPINFNSAIFNTGAVYVHTTSGGVNIIAPHYGDVDLNGIVQAFDAAMILQYLANMIALNQQQKLNADVTLDNTISAYDASVILQYVVHIIDTLPHTSVIIAAGELKMPDGAILPSGFVEVPLNLSNGNNIYSFEAEINFDTEILQYQSIEFSTALSGFVKQSNNVTNSLIIVGASTSPGITAGNYAKIKFSLKPNVSAEDTKIILSKLRLNENAVVTNSDTALISIINNIPGDVSLPTEYSLAQNYPNPFNPATTIKYQLPEASHVTLKIFNVMGELMQVLIDEEKPAGYHQVEFDASKLSSGIYFYEINAGKFRNIKKMILLK